jgi:hypothetical protein
MNLYHGTILNKLSVKELARLRTVSKNFKNAINRRPNLVKKLSEKRKEYNRLSNTLRTWLSKPSKDRSVMSRKNIKRGKILRNKMGGIKEGGMMMARAFVNRLPSYRGPRMFSRNYVLIPGNVRITATNYLKNINNAARVINRVRKSNKTNLNRNNNNGTVYFTAGGRNYHLNRSGYLGGGGGLGVRGVRLSDIFTPSERKRLYRVNNNLPN